MTNKFLKKYFNSLNKDEDKDKNIKVAKEPKINPIILAEWLADGGKDGPYKTPQEYYEAYYGEIDG